MNSTIRLTPDRLYELTGKRRPSAQLRWFKIHYGVSLPCDLAGPVISASAMEALIARRCGIATQTSTEATRPRINRITK